MQLKYNVNLNNKLNQRFCFRYDYHNQLFVLKKIKRNVDFVRISLNLKWKARRNDVQVDM